MASAAAGTALPSSAVSFPANYMYGSYRPYRFLTSVGHQQRSFRTLRLPPKDQPEPTLSADGGSLPSPPRWFSPLECGRRSTASPLLLFLPGIDGDGCGLQLQHKQLGQIFDIWCLHIPLADRTTLSDLVAIIESAIRSEHKRAPTRPTYLVGEAFGASLALVVAARNLDIDLVLILANPASSLIKSLLQSVVPLLRATVKNISLMPDTILWKLRMINEMTVLLNSHLHAVEAQTLILTSGMDMLLSTMTGGETLRSKLRHSDIRSFLFKGGLLLSDGTFDLVATIKGASYYRRGASIDYATDFLPLTPSEFDKNYAPFKWMELIFNTVTLSTMNNGKIVRGLGGIPSEGPVLLVGNHLMIGLDIVPLLSSLWYERNIVVRGMAHPAFFSRFKEGKLPKVSVFDWLRSFGGLPVSPTNLYKVLSSKSHVILYPGGVREALHRKGEEHKLIWPSEPEFVRMAVKFGAKIVPFASVGEDDFLKLVLDYEDQMHIPPMKALNEEISTEANTLRHDIEGEIGKQALYYPICLPNIMAGRLYFLFGKPILTEGKGDILKEKDKVEEMYVKIQDEVQKCIDYLKIRRETDPHRNLFARLAYQCLHGFDTQVPTFEI